MTAYHVTFEQVKVTHTNVNKEFLRRCTEYFFDISKVHSTIITINRTDSKFVNNYGELDKFRIHKQ
jgi:hypothetical protein